MHWGSVIHLLTANIPFPISEIIPKQLLQFRETFLQQESRQCSCADFMESLGGAADLLWRWGKDQHHLGTCGKCCQTTVPRSHAHIQVWEAVLEICQGHKVIGNTTHCAFLIIDTVFNLKCLALILFDTACHLKHTLLFNGPTYQILISKQRRLLHGLNSVVSSLLHFYLGT